MIEFEKTCHQRRGVTNMDAALSFRSPLFFIERIDLARSGSLGVGIAHDSLHL